MTAKTILTKAVLFPPCIIFGGLYGIVAYVSAAIVYVAAKLEGVFYWFRQRLEA